MVSETVLLIAALLVALLLGLGIPLYRWIERRWIAEAEAERAARRARQEAARELDGDHQERRDDVSS